MYFRKNLLKMKKLAGSNVDITSLMNVHQFHILQNHFKSLSIFYLIMILICFSNKKYYKLSFEYTSKYDDDMVSIALCPPYTYSQLLQFIQNLIDAQRNRNDGI